MKFKKLTLLGVSAALTAAMLIPTVASAAPKGIDYNGAHYNLNLIGKAKNMPGDYDNPDRHTMFVPLSTADMTFGINTPNNLGVDENGNPITTMDGIKIEMTQGDEFAMIDGNATDGYGALQIGEGRYHVVIAVKAKSPKVENAYTDITGWVEAYDNLGDMWYYLDIGDVSVKKNGSWTDASDLFFVDTTEDSFGLLNGNEEEYEDGLGMWVFDYMDGLDNWYEESEGAAPYDLSDLAYFWQLQNNGNKLIQVRFYPM